MGELRRRGVRRKRRTGLDVGFGASGETRTLVGRFARQFTKLLLSLLSHAGLKW